MKKKYGGLILFTMMLVILLGNVIFSTEISAKEKKKYGILIGDEKGNYHFIDKNEVNEDDAHIEQSPNGNLMIPLKSVVRAMEDLTYSYDKKLKRATVTNQNNGRKIVYSKNSKYIYTYTKTSKKGTKRKMTYQMFVSKDSGVVMVHMSSLKWVMGNVNGYRYYKRSHMETKGYDTEIYSGTVVYNPYGAVKKLPLATKVKGISQTVRVTIPEGYAVAQIFELLMKKGVVKSTKELYDTMETYDYSYYPLIGAIDYKTERAFKLEGYLYPDTYEFNRLSKPQDALGKFLRNGKVKITQAHHDRANELGYTMDEILTIASIIEKEAGNHGMMPTISSVIHNRLGIKMKLEMDCSTYYVERYVKPNITGDINRYNSFYNTYKARALPAGPICNPSMEAIEAALYPEETDYLFFYSDDNHEYHFSKEYVNSSTAGDVAAEE